MRKSSCNDGETHGIDVWYDLNENQISQDTPESPENTFTISVHEDITQCRSTEYVHTMLPEYPDRQDTLVAVNRRRVAVNRRSQRGVVLPVARIPLAPAEEANVRLQAWLASPVSPFYVVHVDELSD